MKPIYTPKGAALEYGELARETMKLLKTLLITIVIILVYMLCGTAHADPLPVQDMLSVIDELTEWEEDINILAQLIFGEARGVESDMEKAAVAWCALNRVDDGHRGTNIQDVVSAKSQFAWSPYMPVEQKLKELAKDVLIRWLMEKRGVEDVGRVLPKGWLYFAGRGGHNWFRETDESTDYWTWEYENPYES